MAPEERLENLHDAAHHAVGLWRALPTWLRSTIEVTLNPVTVAALAWWQGLSALTTGVLVLSGVWSGALALAWLRWLAAQTDAERARAEYWRMAPPPGAVVSGPPAPISPPQLTLTPQGGRAAVVEVYNAGGAALISVRARIVSVTNGTSPTDSLFDVTGFEIKKGFTQIVELAECRSGHEVSLASVSLNSPARWSADRWVRSFRIVLVVDFYQTKDDEQILLERREYAIETDFPNERLRISDLTEF